ncbi:MAG: hypothetical protein ABIH76_01080 [Candidatus Bathyarchaeota archaeon]
MMFNLRDSFVNMIRPQSGCELANTTPFAIFKGIFEKTNGDICNGCAYKQNCSFLEKQIAKEEQRKKENFGKVNFETNAQIAERLSKKMGKEITPRQVSKMRKRGEL